MWVHYVQGTSNRCRLERITEFLRDWKLAQIESLTRKRRFGKGKKIPSRTNFRVPCKQQQLKGSTKHTYGKGTKCNRLWYVSCRLSSFCPGLYVPPHSLSPTPTPTFSLRQLRASLGDRETCRPSRFHFLGAGSGLKPNGSPLMTSAILCRESAVESVSASPAALPEVGGGTVNVHMPNE